MKEAPASTAEVVKETAAPAPKQAHTNAELVEMQLGINADAPLCFSCGTKMQRAGSCYLCEAADRPAVAADLRRRTGAERIAERRRSRYVGSASAVWENGKVPHREGFHGIFPLCYTVSCP